MTYEEIVYAVRNTFENADARSIFEHVAVQVNIVGEGAGIFYFEVAERHCCVEPYDYYDHDCLLTTTGEVLMELCEKKYGMRKGIEDGKIKFEGNARKLNLCLDNIILPGTKKTKKKETKAETKPEAKKEVKAETKTEAKKEVKAETKTEAKKEVKAETKPESKKEVKAETKPETK